MSLSVGDILQVSDYQVWYSQLVLNVYFYQMGTFESGVTYQVIADQWETQVRTPVRAIQMPGLTHTATVIKNLTNGVDIWEETDVATGSRSAGDNTPGFVALGFRLVRSSAITRHGSKRFAGIGEADMNGNNYTFPAGTQAALETALKSPVAITGTMDNDFTMTPVIIGRVPSGEPHAGELDLSIINPIADAQYIRVTSQNTRKVGRGA